MTTDHRPDELLAAYLAEGIEILPDRVIDAVLDEAHRTRQRAGFGLRRTRPMFRTLLGATAVIAVLLLGGAAWSGAFVGGTGGAPSPTPVPTPAPTPLPLTTQTQLVSGTATYRAGAPFPIPVTMTIPGDWTANIGGSYAVVLDKVTGNAGEGATVTLTLNQTLYADPCTGGADLAPQPGPTVDDLAAALANLPGIDATTPTAVTVDGFHGTQLTLTAPADSSAGCSGSSDGYEIWRLPMGAIFAMSPGEQMALTILDIDGDRLVISSETYPATTAQEQAEVKTILDSIHFD
jgi:hypothetical protein